MFVYSSRWCFWLNAITTGLSLILFLLCYFPPNFEQLTSGVTKREQIRRIDYVGLLLYSGGLVCLLLALCMLFILFTFSSLCNLAFANQECFFLAWGGKQYPWNSAAVISTLVIGVVVLISFALYGMLFTSTWDDSFSVDLLTSFSRDLHATQITPAPYEAVQDPQLRRGRYCWLGWSDVLLRAQRIVADTDHQPLHHRQHLDWMDEREYLRWP